jgi:hypothetical protein
MTDAAKVPTADRTSIMKMLGTIIDYAIIESAELRLPLLVYILRKARLELERAVTPASAGKERVSVDEP